MHSRFFKIRSFSALQYLTLLLKKVFFGKQLFSQTTLKQENNVKKFFLKPQSHLYTQVFSQDIYTKFLIGEYIIY
jgi:hypothetical protein